LNRFGRTRWPILIALGALLMMVVSSCSGAAAATSWPGLVVVDGIIYAADLEQVHALDAETGESLWAYPVDTSEARRGLFYVTPAVDDEHVIVASAAPPSGFLSSPQNVVWALDGDGRELWSFRSAEGQYVEGGAIGGEFFVIGNSDGNVYALDLQNGQLRWKFETGHRVWATPLIVEDRVYIGSMDRTLYALNLANGSEIWSFDAVGAFAGTPVLVDGTLYIGTFANNLYAIDAETGTNVWERPFTSENWFWGSPTTDGATIYVCDVDGVVYAIDPESGMERWHKALTDDRGKPAPVRAAVALSEDREQLFVGSETGTLFALDTADEGRVAWDWDAEDEGRIVSSPVVSGINIYQPIIRQAERIIAFNEVGARIWAHPPQVEE
jgi:outer membrane protein assembly factor BamB